jgi:tRNA G18 (ribose-2'-O)-methylase SpoU
MTIDLNRNEIYVILDKIINGYNLGAILRLCDVTLVKKLFIVYEKNAVAKKVLKCAENCHDSVDYKTIILEVNRCVLFSVTK